MNTTVSRQASQRGPSAVSIFWSCMRVPSGITLISPCSSTGKRYRRAAQRFARLPRERAERIVGVGDAAFAVAADDQIALRFEQAHGARLGLLELPGEVGQLLAAHLGARNSMRSRLLRDITISMTPHIMANRPATPIANSDGS